MIKFEDVLLQISLDQPRRHINDPYVSQNLLILCCLRPHLIETSIKLGKLCQELVASLDTLEFSRDERSGLDGFVSFGEGGAEGWDGTGENGEFTSDVGTVQVVCGMRFLS